ncbi:MAG: MFS transporter [Bryobacteraceae bacterium]
MQSNQLSSTPVSNSVRRREIRTLMLASLGSALEFYDFVVFVFFIGILGDLFFPPELPEWLRQLQTFGIFAAGYIARPLGGILMAHFGDRHGRKRIFTLSVLLMALPTLAIALLPTYRSIGIAAPLLLLSMRLLQGVAIGGEAPGAWVFVAEHAPRGRAGLAIGLLTSGLTFGILLGSLVATGLNLAFNQAQITGTYWRVPFFLGGVLGIGAMLLRRWLSETPVFEEMRTRLATSRELPLRSVLTHHKVAVLASMLASWMLTATIVVVILISPALLQKIFAIPPTAVQLSNLAGTATLCLSVLMVGMAADRFGIRRVAVPMLLSLIVATYALYLGAAKTPSALLPLYVFAGFGAGSAVLAPLFMVNAFPPEVRFSGVSFSYNVIYAVLGGITPPAALWLAHVNPIGPAHYVAVAAVAGLAAIWLGSGRGENP